MPDEKNSSYRGFTESQARAHKKYIAQFVEMKVRTTPERRETIQTAAAAVGQSVNAYINQAIDERMNRADAAQKPTDAFSGGGATPRYHPARKRRQRGLEMEISYSRAAVKVITTLDRPTKQRIKKAVEGLPKGDIVRLSGSTRLYRLRVGDWRVVFSYPAENSVLIERIAPRGDVYKGGLLCL